MKKKLRDWMLEEDAGAGPQLDALRARILAPRLTFREVLQGLFRPAGAWVALALAWIGLLVTNQVVNRSDPAPTQLGLTAADAAFATSLVNEIPAPLNHHS